MLLMFDKGIERWITQAVKSYAKANNKYMKEQFNSGWVMHISSIFGR